MGDWEVFLPFSHVRILDSKLSVCLLPYFCRAHYQVVFQKSKEEANNSEPCVDEFCTIYDPILLLVVC